MIIKTVSGEYINLNHARSWSFRRSRELGQCTLVYEFDNGNAYNAEIHRVDQERLENSFQKTLPVPAEPGYFRLAFFSKDDGGEETVNRWPILAWQLDIEFGFHTGITAWSDRGADNEDNWAILCPDGRVIVPGLQYWDNEAAWLEDRREEETRKKKLPDVIPTKL